MRLGGRCHHNNSNMFTTWHSTQRLFHSNYSSFRCCCNGVRCHRRRPRCGLIVLVMAILNARSLFACGMPDRLGRWNLCRPFNTCLDIFYPDRPKRPLLSQLVTSSRRRQFSVVYVLFLLIRWQRLWMPSGVMYFLNSSSSVRAQTMI